jgi:hypothetical protein
MFFFLYFLLMLFVRLPLNAPSRQQYKVNSGKSSERAANSASQIPKMSSKHTRHSASGGRRSHHGFLNSSKKQSYQIISPESEHSINERMIFL